MAPMPLTLHRTPHFAAAHDVAHGLWRAEAGLLVVPDRRARIRALQRAAREAGGVSVTGDVTTWSGLRATVFRQAGLRPSEAPSRVAVRLALQEAVASTPLTAVAASARGPGFVAALEAAVAEVRGAGLDAEQVTAAAADPVSADIAALLRAVADVPHPADVHWAAVAAAQGLTTFPPVVAVGQDDLAPSAWAFVRALARVAPVHVVVPHTDGRRGFAARHARQRRWAAQADALMDHPAPDPGIASVVFEDRPPVDDPRTIVRVGAVGTRGMHRAGLEALRGAILGGVPAHECALVVPSLARARDDLDRLLADWDLPAWRSTRRRVLETPLGLALVALLRAGAAPPAAPDALDALLGWLRTPYSGADPDEVDAFERDARRHGDVTRAGLIARWGDVLDGARRVVAAGGQGPQAQLAALVAAGSEALSRRPAAALPTDADILDRRALIVLAGAVADLGDEPDPDEGPPRSRGPLPAGALGTVMADLTVLDERGAPGGIAVLDYAGLRGQAFRVVALCGLDGDGYPAAPAPDALLGGMRSALSTHLVPRAPGTSEARLRFVHALGAATERLVLVRRVADDDGRPVAPSPFWMEACRAMGRSPDGLDVRPTADGEIPDTVADAITEREALRRLALDQVVVPGPLARAAARRVRPTGLDADAFDDVTRMSVTEVETFLGCPYGWFHGAYLRPEPLRRPFDFAAEGTFGHRVMALVYQEVAASADPGPCTAERLPRYRAALGAAVEQALAERRERDEPDLPAGFAARLGVHLDLLLANEAAGDPRMTPVRFEYAVSDDVLTGVDPPLAVVGRLDRLDSDGRRAVVVDYKRSARNYSGEETVEKRFQPPLYGHLVGERLGLESVGGVFVALLGGGRAGVVCEGVDYARAGVRELAPGRWRALTDDAVTVTRRVAQDLRAGRLGPPPAAGCPPWCGCGDLWR